jgi:ubiquitin-conjugating enzyme E2 Z
MYRTWRGERGEEWSSAQGLESILISIQSLMSSNPYENEPGFEDAKSDNDKKNISEYIAKVCQEKKKKEFGVLFLTFSLADEASLE